MLEKSEIRSLIADSWRAAGLSGRGRRWTYAGSEIQWLVTLEGDWLGRISMTADAKFTDAPEGDYPLRIFADCLPTIDAHRLAMALHVDTNVSDDVRREVVRESARTIAEFVTAHDTMGSLRTAYRSGSLDSMSIRKDLRAALEQP